MGYTTFENLERIVGRKEERARVADQIPVVQAKSLILARIEAFKNGMIRLSRNGRLWRGEPVVAGTRLEFTFTDGKKKQQPQDELDWLEVSLDGQLERTYVKFQGKENHIPKERHPIDWLSKRCDRPSDTKPLRRPDPRPYHENGFSNTIATPQSRLGEERQPAKRS
jgi:hypothetical protein